MGRCSGCGKRCRESAELRAWVLLSAITALRPRNRFALCCRFGLGTWRELSQREAADFLSRSTTAIQHATDDALRLLNNRRWLFANLQPENPVNHPQDTPDESLHLALSHRPLCTEFLAAIVAELSHLERVAGDLEPLDHTASRRRRTRQATVPQDAAGWTEEIVRALQHAQEVRRDETGDYDLGALLTAVVVRSCLHRRRPRVTNEEMHELIGGIPAALLPRDGDLLSIATVFARWYLDTHVAFGVLGSSLRDRVWSAICAAGASIANLPVEKPRPGHETSFRDEPRRGW